jgi:hypothetical protein
VDYEQSAEDRVRDGVERSGSERCNGQRDESGGNDPV